MTELEYTSATANETARAVIASALTKLPDLDGGTTNAQDLSSVLTNLANSVAGAAEARIATAINTVLTTAYNDLITDLGELNDTLETEFTAI